MDWGAVVSALKTGRWQSSPFSVAENVLCSSVMMTAISPFVGEKKKKKIPAWLCFKLLLPFKLSAFSVIKLLWPINVAKFLASCVCRSLQRCTSRMAVTMLRDLFCSWGIPPKQTEKLPLDPRVNIIPGCGNTQLYRKGEKKPAPPSPWKQSIVSLP